MAGNYTPLPVEIRKEMDQMESDGDSPKAKRAKRKEELDEWWYSGQRRYGMSAEERMTEMEDRLRPANPLGAIGPLYKNTAPPIEKDPLSIDDMKKMSVAEAAAPLLDNIFGTLLAYAAPDKNFDSRRIFSKFEQSPAWQIDTGDKGNASFFGENWSSLSKKTGRDPRYKSTF